LKTKNRRNHRAHRGNLIFKIKKQSLLGGIDSKRIKAEKIVGFTIGEHTET
jgi:hypothetical protein